MLAKLTKTTLTPVLFALIALFSAAAAQTPAGHETIYNAPTKVNLGGRPVVADIALHVDEATARNGVLRLALTTDVTKFIDQTKSDLEAWVAARSVECGERWDASEPLIEFPDGAIRFAVDLEFGYWSCGWNGKDAPRRLALEAGGVDITLIPQVVDGKLQARVGSLTITKEEGVSKYLPLEFVARRVIDAELKKLNDNPKFYRAPKPLIDEGFAYESINADTVNGRVVITARYRARTGAGALDRIVEAMETEGVTQ
ncbi:MAG: hypothetical protein AAGD92_01970 [Pseudomonadota bacterium]